MVKRRTPSSRLNATKPYILEFRNPEVRINNGHFSVGETHTHTHRSGVITRADSRAALTVWRIVHCDRES